MKLKQFKRCLNVCQDLLNNEFEFNFEISKFIQVEIRQFEGSQKNIYFSINNEKTKYFDLREKAWKL